MEIIERPHFDTLLHTLQEAGYTTIGPVMRDGVLFYDEVAASADFPIGWTDTQEEGTYRSRQTDTPLMFGYTHGPQSWKKFLYPPRTRLFSVNRQGKSLKIDGKKEAQADADVRFAFIGARACEINAMLIQDAVFRTGPYADPLYQKRRDEAFIVAVQCGRAGGTCFCDSMGAGPEVKENFDLVLTEFLDQDRHYFTVESGSERGAEVLKCIPHHAAKETDTRAVAKQVRNARSEMGRSVNTKHLPKILAESIESPVWNDIATRCLTCANCTLVCPTCFCSTVEETVDLGLTHAERIRRWDSCFTLDFAKVVGGNFRSSASARYRQWLTHKFSYWVDQFGASGCVGCGRCITWCPAHIDITKELDRLRSNARPDHKSA